MTFPQNLRVNFPTIRDHAFTVTGSPVLRSRRFHRGSNMQCTIHVQPVSKRTNSLALQQPLTPGQPAPGRRAHLLVQRGYSET